MCAPAVIPLISAIGAIGSAGQALGIFGGRDRNQTPQQRDVTPAPSVKAAGPAAQAAGDDEKTKKVDESIKVQQNAKQKRDKQTVKKGTAALGALPGVNTGITNTADRVGVNAP